MNRFAPIFIVWVWLSAPFLMPSSPAAEPPAVAVDQEAAKALEAALAEAGVVEPLPEKADDQKSKDTKATDTKVNVKEDAEAPPPGIEPIWYIELSAHLDRLDAEVEASAFGYRRLGAEAALVRKNPEKRFSVLVGPFEKRAAAQQRLSVLELDSLAGANPRLVDLNQFE